MRADERDVRHYFRRRVGVSVRDVQLLRDKRTGRHRGCAYVELGSLTDVTLALASTGTVPDFQRFPILVKHSEAEKNAAPGSTALGIGGDMTAASSSSGTGPGGSEAQKVYVGSIDAAVTQAQLYALFSAFGPLQKVLLQMDPLTGQSRGFAFLSYRDARDANLAIRTMGGQVVAGRQL
ncbi:hypothetical protein THAOC_18547 [Thalassiosira oceanica]|uniref:RRM domain-containing protein n=1 Tax=Thalassiosira oceanica TaxID=159749 RepID=K0S6V7_THAOC|nr:hypothetical protein THAOC_18547 [Thalassiosira oceanica]|eukprot:EJK61025.1 hypothetical protein THAOC_18547 [Thalassiosira oceanica]